MVSYLVVGPLANRLEHGVYSVSRMRESAANRYKAFQIPMSWLLDNGIVSQVTISAHCLFTLASSPNFKGYLYILFTFARPSANNNNNNICDLIPQERGRKPVQTSWIVTVLSFLIINIHIVCTMVLVVPGGPGV